MAEGDKVQTSPQEDGWMANALRLSLIGHMHFRHVNPGLDAPSKMHVVIFNVPCKMDVRAMQKYSSLYIICRVSLTWREMDAGLLQSKMHGSLSFNPKWMLVCMPECRGIFCPNMYIYEHAKCM
jgi:hypothetical protein